MQAQKLLKQYLIILSKNCMNKSLKKFNTFKIDVKAKKIIIAKKISDIYKAWKLSKIKKIPLLILGCGSNVLFISNFIGIVIINKIKGIDITEDKNFWYFHICSGEKWNYLVRFSLLNGFFGLENLALIPGTVGAAAIQNIGAYGLEFQEVCNYVDLFNCKKNNISRFNVKQCKFGYRKSIFKNCYIKGFFIVAIGLILKKSWKPIINYSSLKDLNIKKIKPQYIFEFICKIRRKKIPDFNIIGNAGSFFINPILNMKNAKNILNRFPKIHINKISKKRFKIFAGWLIEQCNLKGYSIGGAVVCSKNALIIANKNNSATWKDVFLLFKHVRKCVKKKFNILLKPEVQFINSSIVI